MWSSLAVLIGLVGVALGLKWADAVAQWPSRRSSVLPVGGLGGARSDTLIDTAGRRGGAVERSCSKVPRGVSEGYVRAGREELFVELIAA